MAVILTTALTYTAGAQQPVPEKPLQISTLSANDTIKVADTVIVNDTLSLTDTTFTDTTDTDTIKGNSRSALEQRLGIRISPDALPSIVKSEASDSAILNMKDNLFYLYGDAKIVYEDLTLNAGKVVYDQQNNLITAVPEYDSLGQPLERPTFTQGAETVSYDSLQYNFKSKRAKIRNARSQYGEGYVYSQQVKRNPDQSIYGLDNIYTTCALDTPHFGIRAKKIKVVPQKVVASGPANMTIEQVPTPLFLPFGLFPISKGQSSGFVLPAYTLEEQRGLGLTNGGYYLALSEYIDLLVQGNIYSKGSYSLSGISTYRNRYRYEGSLAASYAYNKQGEVYEPGGSVTKDFIVQWEHRSDPKSRPGVNFNASVNAGTSSFYSNNSYNTNQILNNQFQSNITYSKVWANKPYSLTVSARHNQNTQTRLVNVSLPEVAFNIAQITPFQSKNSVGNKWYEKITASYTLNGVNTTSFYDTSFSFNTLALNDFNNGVTHSIPINASYQLFRFINFTTNINYTEYWLTRQTYQYFNTNTEQIDTSIYRGFYTARDFTSTATIGTRIYGIKTFKKGKLAGIRHVIEPSVGIGYIPDYAANPFNYYYRTRLSLSGTPEYRPLFDGAIPRVPGQGQYGDFSSRLTYGINNNLQIKVRTNNDSAGTKIVSIFDGLSLNGSYDLAKDSFNWDPVNISFRTNVLNILNVSGGAIFDPYDFDLKTGRRLPVTTIANGNGIARFTSANLSLQATLRSKQSSSRGKEAANANDQVNRLLANGRYYDYVDFDIPWSLNVSYAMTASRVYLSQSQRDTIQFDHNAMFSGDFNITPRWKVAFTSGYNFTTKALQLTSIDIYRDLHCWEMRLSTIPFGERKSYSFTLNVKAQVLQDLKLLRRRDFRDAVR